MGQKPKKRLTAAQQKRFVQQAGKCLACGNPDITLLEVHHIKPRAKRGSNNPWNLSVLCPTCHKKAQNGLITSPALAPKPSPRGASGLAFHDEETDSNRLQIPVKTAHEIRVELADRVYTPLLKEVSLWKELGRSLFSEWTRLEKEQRMWTKLVPKPIVDLLAEGEYLFAIRERLWGTLNTLIENAVKAQAPSILGPDTARNMTNFQFGLSIEPDGFQALYLLGIWESKKDLSNYIMDIIEPRYPPGSKWKLETRAIMLPSGTVKLAGGTIETKALMNRVLSYLMYQQPAREFLENSQRIKDHAEKILALIDAELVSR